MDWEKKIAYVKDEGSNLTQVKIILKSFIKCEVLSLDESFPMHLFWPYFSKAC
jgi:hypothetical protein